MTNENQMSVLPCKPWGSLRVVSALVVLGMAFSVEGEELVPAFERLSLGEIKPAGLSDGRQGDEIAAMREVRRRDAWHGYSRTVFAFDGGEAWGVEPKTEVSCR